MVRKAVVQRCSVKKTFFEILQNSQENTCARASFLIKLQVWDLQLYWKRDSGTDVFLWILALRLLLKAIATLFSIGKALRNRVSCFSSLFLTKVKISLNVSGVIQKSALNCSLMARSFLFFYICLSHSFSR